MTYVYILLAFGLGWLVAQTSKLIAALIRQRGRMSFGQAIEWMVKSGGMPSGHTASFTAAGLSVGLIYGFDTPAFALAVCMGIIIVYDAINVRYAVGEQGRIMNEMISKDRDLKDRIRMVRIVEGHTIPQVMVGFIVGVLVALLVMLIRIKLQG